MATMTDFNEHLAELIQRGGYIMIPLLAMSVIAVALIIERSWFWLLLHGGGRMKKLTQLNNALRQGDKKLALGLIDQDRSPYGEVARRLLEDGATDAIAVEVTELQRPRLNRFMVALSTIITAAPLLGILGTVTGIIQSFNLLGEQSTLTDPRAVSAGIAEALLTTALGLIVAILTLFPYMIFRSHVDRAMGRLESVIAAAQQGSNVEDAGSHHPAKAESAPTTIS